MTPTAASPPHTATPVTREACHTVLGTAELLEAILLEVPPLDLFIIQRVSAEWQDAIAASMKIQQRMFLRPIEEKERWFLQGRLLDRNGGHKHRPLTCAELRIIPTSELASNVSSSSITSSAGGQHVFKRIYRQDFTPAKTCPLLSKHGDDLGLAVRLHEGALESGPVIDVEDLIKHPGSWKKMYLTNPPCKTATLQTEIYFPCLPCSTLETSTEVRKDVGLTLGDLLYSVLHGVQDDLCVLGEEEMDEGISDPDEPIIQCNITVADALSKHGFSMKGLDGLKLCCMRLKLDDVALPTDRERALVKRGRLSEILT